MRDFEPQFRLVSELQRLGERAFVHKLKKKDPDITPDEIANEVDRWYLRRPTGTDDGFSIRVDISVFNSKKIWIHNNSNITPN